MRADLLAADGVQEDQDYGDPSVGDPFSSVVALEPSALQLQAWEEYVAAVKDYSVSLSTSIAAVKRWPARTSTSPFTANSDESRGSARSSGGREGRRDGRSFAANAIANQLLACSVSLLRETRVSPLHDTSLEAERKKVLQETADCFCQPGERVQALVSTHKELHSPLSSLGCSVRPSSPLMVCSSFNVPPFSAPTAADLRDIFDGSRNDAMLHRDRSAPPAAFAPAGHGYTRSFPQRVPQLSTKEDPSTTSNHFSEYEVVQRDIAKRLAEIRTERNAADLQRLIHRQKLSAVLIQAVVRGWIVRRSSILAALRIAREKRQLLLAQQHETEAIRQRNEQDRLSAMLIHVQKNRDKINVAHNTRFDASATAAQFQSNLEDQRRLAAFDFEQKLVLQLRAVQAIEEEKRRLEADTGFREEDTKRRCDMDQRADVLMEVDELRASIVEEQVRIQQAAKQVAASNKMKEVEFKLRAEECIAMAREEEYSRKAEIIAQQRCQREQMEVDARHKKCVTASAEDVAMASSCPSVVSPNSDLQSLLTRDCVFSSSDVVTKDVSARMTSVPVELTVPMDLSQASTALPADEHCLSSILDTQDTAGSCHGHVRRIASAGGRAVMMLRPVSQTTERMLTVTRLSAAQAARSFQALWRGHRLRRDHCNPLYFRQFARMPDLVRRITCFQALFRGCRIRRALRVAREAARFSDHDDFDYAAVDIGDLLCGLPAETDLLSAERAVPVGPRSAWGPASTDSALTVSSGTQARVRNHHTASEAFISPHESSVLRVGLPPIHHESAYAVLDNPVLQHNIQKASAPICSSSDVVLQSTHVATTKLQQQWVQGHRAAVPRPDSSSSWELASVHTTDDDAGIVMGHVGGGSWSKPVPPVSSASLNGGDSLRSRHPRLMNPHDLSALTCDSGSNGVLNPTLIQSADALLRSQVLQQPYQQKGHSNLQKGLSRTQSHRTGRPRGQVESLPLVQAVQNFLPPRAPPVDGARQYQGEQTRALASAKTMAMAMASSLLQASSIESISSRQLAPIGVSDRLQIRAPLSLKQQSAAAAQSLRAIRHAMDSGTPFMKTHEH